MVTRKRCSECGRRYTPSPRARSTQRVCGAECRAARDRKLARVRRRREIDDYRADERVRQQASRAARAKAPPAALGAPCHAPASTSTSSELQDEIIHFLDHAVDVSRATLLRDLRRNWPRLCENVAKAGGVSRTSFGGQVPDSSGRSASDPAGRHA
jgi:hypothetical protein